MASKTDVTLHVYKGQSNSAGLNADETATPPVFPNRTQYSSRRTNRAFQDISRGTPGVLGAPTGSSIYFFLDYWRQRTEEPALGLMTAVGGTGLLQAAGSGSGPEVWQVGSPNSLDDTSDLYIRNAVAGIRLSKRFNLTGLYIHWCQGERESTMYNGTTVTDVRYTQELQRLHDRAVRTCLDLKVPMRKFCVYETGYNTLDPTAANWQLIRAAQRKFVSDNPNTALMAWDRAKETTPLTVDADGNWISGWSYADNVHYTTAGYRAMGRGAVDRILKAGH